MRPVLCKLTAAAAAATALLAGGPLAAGEWRIASLDGAPTEGDARIAFAPDGSFAGSTGCNLFQGAGRIAQGRLVIDGPVATTRMACPGAALTRQEDGILGLLGGEVDLAFDPFADTLVLSRGATRVALTAAGAAPAQPPMPEASPGPDTPEPQAMPLAEAGFVNVFGVSDRLNIHAEPSVSSPVVGKAPAGTLFRSKGCQAGDAHDWCNVVHLDASGLEGWAAAEYLEPAVAAIRAGQGVFDQIGTLACTDAPGAPGAKCDYGVARDPDGTAVVAVFRSDGRPRLLTFVDGVFSFADSSEAGGGFDAAGTRAGESTIVTVDGERYEVPDYLLSGE